MICAVVAASAFCPGAMASPSAADRDARATYRDGVEPICKRNTLANRGILRGIRAKVRQGKLKPAGRQLIRAAGALRGALVKLRKVSRPEADAERLSDWLAGVARQVTLLRQAGRALIQGKRRRAESIVTRLTNGARLINALVVSFSFTHCRLELPQYT